MFEGDEDWLLPKSAGMMMKYYTTLLLGGLVICLVVETYFIRAQRLVFSDQPDIVRYHWSKISVTGAFEDTHILHPEYQVGYTIAGEFELPYVLYAMLALGMDSPLCSAQSPNWKVSYSCSEVAIVLEGMLIRS